MSIRPAARWTPIAAFLSSAVVSAVVGVSFFVQMDSGSSGPQKQCDCLYCPPAEPIGKAGGQDLAEGADGGDPCCGGEGDHNDGGGGGMSGGGNTAHGGDGSVLHATTDIASGGFGGWGHTRVLAYPCKLDEDPFGFHEGWKVQQAAKLAFDSGKVYPTNGGRWEGTLSQQPDGTFTGNLFYQSKLTFDPLTQEFTLVDTMGGKTIYDSQGLFKRYDDPAGNSRVATWGTVAGKKRLLELVISETAEGTTVTESWLYEWIQSGVNAAQCERVTLRRKVNAGSFAMVRTAFYTYYDTTNANGNLRDLELAEISGPDGLIERKYYRWWPNKRLRSAVYQRAAERLWGAGSGTLTGVRALPHASVEGYAVLYTEWQIFPGLNPPLRLSRRTNRLADGRKGTSTFEYMKSPIIDEAGVENLSDADKMGTWIYRCRETLPDGNLWTVYLNPSCMPLLKVFNELSTGKEWRWFYKYDDKGRLIWQAEPSAVSGYEETALDLMRKDGLGGYLHIRDTDGLIRVFTYNPIGYKFQEFVRKGDKGTDIPKLTTTYTPQTALGVTVFPVGSKTVYRNEGGGGPITTTFTYTWQGTGLAKASQLTTHPVVPTSQNGSGVAQAAEERYDFYGRMIWDRDEDGYIGRNKYDTATGAVKESIADVNTAVVSDEPSGWVTPAGGGLHLVTLREIEPAGRPKKITDPKGNVTYRTYHDAGHEVRVYAGWDTTTNRPTGPTHVHREDWARNYDEKLTMSAQPAVLGGEPTGQEAIASVETLTRKILDGEFRVQQILVYRDFTGVTYTPSTPVLGTFPTNYDLGTFSYDSRWRVIQTQRSNYTVETAEFDGLSQLLRRYKGVPGGSLYKVVENEYDFNLAGDGNLTKATSLADDATSYATEYRYDWQNRQTASRGPDRLTTQWTLDNLGQRTRTDTFADANSDFVLTANELRNRLEPLYDERGRAWRNSVYEVDPVTGAPGDRLITDVWTDGRGNVVKSKSPTGLLTKTGFDGLGRTIRTYSSTDSTESTYSQAFDVTGDTVIEQSNTYFDKAGNVAAASTFKRNDNASGTGALTPLNSFVDVSVSWFDKGNRLTHTANYGRDNGPTNFYVYSTSGVLIDVNANGIPDEAEAAPREPNTSDDYLVTKTEYDSSGFAYRLTDNLGRVTQKTFDRRGRDLKTISNYVDGVVGPAEYESDRTVERVLGYGGRLERTIVYNPKGASVEQQVTRQLYESPFDSSWVTNIIYPDSPDTTSAGTDQEKTIYDRMGRKTQFTDQRGVVHQYGYDSAGRLSADTVTTLPAGVDGSVRRIGTTYDDQSQVELVTSYSDTAGTAVVNQQKYTRNSWDRVSKIEQATAGAVGTGTPAVEYIYSDGASGGIAKYVRPTRIIYPTSLSVYPTYPAAGTIGDALNRMEAYSTSANGSTDWASYTYFGSGGLLKVQLRNGLALDYGTGGTYSGLDRFGRIVNQEWKVSTNIRDKYVYTYDRMGMRTSKDVLATGAPTNRDESYVYDGLYRLKKFNRGTLSGGTIPDASASFNHVWQLDGLGNWSVFQEDADGGANGFATQTRAHNKANEIDLDDSHSNAPGDAIAGTPNWVDPTYDAAGCLTKGPQPGAEGTALHFVYDGWARLAEVKADSGGSPGATVAQYRYNGIHWRIRKILTGSDTFDYYYGENWQVLEVRRTPNGGTTRRAEQLLWHATYMDAPIVRWRNADNSSNGSTEETKYFTYDANHNVTALTSTTGAVNERYAYEAYGKVTVFDANWNVLGASSFGVDLLFAGMRRDGETGLYQVRHRYYHVTLGRFLSRDPVLANRMLQMYLYALANPLMFTDPSGEWPRWLEKAVSKAKFVVNVVVNTVKEIPATFASGEAVDSLSGWVQGASGGLVKTTPPYGHQAAHAGGVGIGTETLKAAASSAVPGGWAAQGLYATGEALVEGKSWDEAILAGGEEALMSKLGGGG